MNAYERLLLENKAWAAEITAEDPEYFQRLAKLQTPEFLWIGCSDSRVPANQITGTLPGEVFVHRNIANLAVPDDANMLGVLHYAVTYLKVKHVIVCGHYGCGGVKASMDNDSYGLLDNWLGNIRKVYDENLTEMESLPTPEARADLLAELNVKQQVRNLAGTEVIKKAWENGHFPEIHGWIYGLKDGILKPLSRVSAPVKEPSYQVL